MGFSFLILATIHWLKVERMTLVLFLHLLQLFLLDFWKNLLQLDIAPKLKFFVWKLFQGDCPSFVAIFSWGLKANALCSICQGEDESMDHIFLRYSWVSLVWFGSPFNIQVLPTVSILWLQDLFFELVTDKQCWSFQMGLFYYLCWFVWKARNKCVFEKEKLNPFSTINLVVKDVGEFVNRKFQWFLPVVRLLIMLELLLIPVFAGLNCLRTC